MRVRYRVDEGGVQVRSVECVCLCVRLGIPSVDLSFRHNEAPTLYGVYHSVYDSFSYVEQQVDPGFKYHQLQARLWGLIALRLAGQRVVPLSPAGKCIVQTC